MQFFGLIANEGRLAWYEMKQYWFETVTSLVLVSGVFIGLFFGVRSLTDSAEAPASLDGLLFGYLLWNFAVGAYGSVAKGLIEDNQKGFIEQLFLCPAGFSRLMLARVVVELAIGMLTMTLLAWIAMSVTGNWLSINFLAFYGLLLIAAPSLVGVGFLISGLALLFKRVEAIGAMLYIAFMGLVAVDGLPLGPLSLLPFTAGASLTRQVILEGQGIVLSDLLVVVVNSTLYLVAGLGIYKWLEGRARKLNLIGQY